MKNQFLKEELFSVRNDVPVRYVIEEVLRIPSKEIEGIFRFQCPRCREMRTAVNERVNLSRCFRCERNFNTIDLVMYDHQKSFVESVKLLQAVYSTQPSSTASPMESHIRDILTALR